MGTNIINTDLASLNFIWVLEFGIRIYNGPEHSEILVTSKDREALLKYIERREPSIEIPDRSRDVIYSKEGTYYLSKVCII